MKLQISKSRSLTVTITREGKADVVKTIDMANSGYNVGGQYMYFKAGKKVGTSGDIIGRYERDEVNPSVEVASKIADVLEVSLDYLTGKLNVEVDNTLLKRVIEVQQMNDDDKEHILYTLDALIKSVKLKSIA